MQLYTTLVAQLKIRDLANQQQFLEVTPHFLHHRELYNVASYVRRSSSAVLSRSWKPSSVVKRTGEAILAGRILCQVLLTRALVQVAS